MNLHLMTPLGHTGYGYAGMNILQQLSINNDIGLTPIGGPSIENQEQAKIFHHTSALSYLIPNDSPCLKIWHQFDLLTRAGKGKYYALPFFEVDSFNQKELYHLNFPDDLIVSCKWAKNIIQQNGIKKNIHIIPMGVDTELFDHTKNQTTNKYVFCTIGKWEKRKAHDTIIHCFNNAFDSNDDVELWLVTNNPFLSKEEESEWLKLVENSKLKSKIKVFPRQPNHESIAKIISYTNCGIYISRGEGWNMELLEFMAMNKPVIASNYSAHTEYCTKDNSYLVDMNEVEPAIDGKWFFGESNWGKIGQNQIDQTIEHMRYCYQNKIDSNENGLNTAKQLSWKNTCDMLVGCMT